MSNLDLNDLLDGWPHEPGQVKARKIIGSDGLEKVQLRIDLGVIQMELQGRPDGQKPFGFESLLDYNQFRAKQAAGNGSALSLSEAELFGLQQEAVQYYHRYLSLFQLRDFQNVIRDTQRNLDVLDFVAEHVQDDEAKWAFDQYRPYILMMNTRAKASLELQQEKTAQAIRLIERGREAIENFYRAIGQPEWIDGSSELAFLNEWLSEVRENLPLSPLETMERDLQRAIADEAYEKAAELRDAIRRISPPSSEK